MPCGNGVHIRDMRTIIEVLAEFGPRMQDADDLTAAIRTRLGRAIIHEIYPGVNELQVITLDPTLEQILMQATQIKGAEGAGLEPGLAENLLQQADATVQRQEQLGLPAVLLVPAPLRPLAIFSPAVAALRAWRALTLSHSFCGTSRADSSS